MKIWMAAALAASLASSAAGQVSIGFDDGKKPNLLCRAWQGSGQLYGWEQVANNPNAQARFDYHARKFFEGTSGYVHIDCLSFENISAGFRATFEPGSFNNSDGGVTTVLRAPFLPQDWTTTPVPTEKLATKRSTAKPTSKPTLASPKVAPSEVAPPKYIEVPGPNGETIRLSPEVAARNKAAADEYRRKLDEHARAKAEAKAEHDRRLALHQQSIATAASAKEQHDREVAAAAERVAAHRLALVEHAGKIAAASTDDDPNRCITSPETKPGLRGNTEVSVTNGCDQKVDIVICLKRTTGDWLCGAQFGILSQRSMTFMSINATGKIYVDAVTFGSNKKLGRPAGIIK